MLAGPLVYKAAKHSIYWRVQRILRIRFDVINEYGYSHLSAGFWWRAYQVVVPIEAGYRFVIMHCAFKKAVAKGNGHIVVFMTSRYLANVG